MKKMLRNAISILMVFMLIACTTVATMAEEIVNEVTEEVVHAPTPAPTSTEVESTPAPTPEVTVEPTVEPTEEAVVPTEAPTAEPTEKAKEDVPEAPIAFTGTVEIEMKNTGELYYGDTVTLRAVIRDANTGYILRWEVNDGTGWTEIEAADKLEYEFIVLEENAHFEYRVVLITEA